MRSTGGGGRERGHSKRKQGKKEQKPSRGAKKRRGEEHQEEEEEESKQQQQADDDDDERYDDGELRYDPRFDDDPIDVHVAKGDGATYDQTFTVGDVKQGLERKWGLPREQQRLYLDHQKREQDLHNDEERLRGMRPAKSAKLTMSVLVDVPDAHKVVEELSVEPSRVLGNGVGASSLPSAAQPPQL